MFQADKTVLVTGATGRQGGAVIRHMLPKGWKLRALTRNAEGYEAQALARHGVEVVQGDLEDPDSIAGPPPVHTAFTVFKISGQLARRVKFNRARMWPTRRKKPT